MNVLVTGASTGIGEGCARWLDARGHRVFAGPLLFPHGVERIDEPLGVGLDVFEQLIDQRQEVLAQPGDAGELRPVRGLVQRQP